MKSFFNSPLSYFSLLLFLSMTSLSASAQFSLGAGGAFGSLHGQAGLNLRIAFAGTNNIRAAADITMYKYDKETVNNVTHHYETHEGNFNGGYILRSGNVFFYPFMGINILRSKIKTEMGTTPVTTAYLTEPGLNVGFGAQYNIEIVKNVFAVSPFVEGKYVISKLDQAVVTAGINFTFGWDKMAGL